jgi:hypothetical protein
VPQASQGVTSTTSILSNLLTGIDEWMDAADPNSERAMLIMMSPLVMRWMAALQRRIPGAARVVLSTWQEDQEHVAAEDADSPPLPELTMDSPLSTPCLDDLARCVTSLAVVNGDDDQWSEAGSI